MARRDLKVRIGDQRGPAAEFFVAQTARIVFVGPGLLSLKVLVVADPRDDQTFEVSSGGLEPRSPSVTNAVYFRRTGRLGGASVC